MKIFKRKISLVKIITIIILFCMIAPAIITCVFFYTQLKNIVYNTIENDISYSSIESFYTLDSNLQSLQNTYYTIISDPFINPTLYENISSKLEPLMLKESIDDRLTKIMFFNTIWNNKLLSSVALFYSNDSYHYINNSSPGIYMDNSGISAVGEVLNRWDGIEKSIDDNKRINSLFSSGQSEDLYYIHDFYDYTSATFKGLVSLQLHKDSLMESFHNFSKHEGSLCFLYDSDNTIIASNDNRLERQKLQSATYNDQSVEKMMTDSKNFILKTQKTEFDLTAVILIPLAPIKKQLFSQLQHYLFIFIVLILCFIVIALFLSKYISRYINILIKRISEVRKGKYSHTIPYFGIIEIDNLSSAFCDMSEQINKLLNDILANEILLKESELKALQAQMNPHFLFNTLLSLSWKVKESGDNESFEMINALSSILKANIYTEKTKFISIKDEIQNVRYYLQIQKWRHGEHFTYDIDIDPELWEQPVLKLGIQPIVENAFVHGLENRIDHGYILIEGSLVNNEVMITIIDNGVGFDTSELEQDLFNHTKKMEDTHYHIGILNTQLRYRYTYGNEYGLTIKSIIGKGTTVLIKYPIIKE